MPFETDTRLAADAEKFFGEYAGTFISEHGQVRADLFQRGDWLEAHVSFPTGLDAGVVTDRYVSELTTYARDHGFEHRLQLILS
jgi:hypothetical protein